MGQDSLPETGSTTAQRRSSRIILIGVGLLWLLLAFALLIYQFANPAKVEITWETATELRTAGFNLYRSTDQTGDFKRINEDQLIDNLGGPASGARYSYIDEDVQAGRTYYYILEEVELDASLNRYDDGLFAYSVPVAIWWAVILTAGSAAIGIVLLISGLRENT